MSKRVENLPFCGILMKPDVDRRGLYEPIVGEFTSLGFRESQRHVLTLDEEDVAYLYPKEVELPIARKKLAGYLTSGTSSLVLLEPRPDQSVVDEIAFLQRVKGDKEQRTGIRAKYDEIGITDNELATKTGRYYDYMMINCFHVFDTPGQLSGFVERRNLTVG